LLFALPLPLACALALQVGTAEELAVPILDMMRQLGQVFALLLLVSLGHQLNHPQTLALHSIIHARHSPALVSTTCTHLLASKTGGQQEVERYSMSSARLERYSMSSARLELLSASESE